MQYKSYLVEQNISNLGKSVALFYGENIGLKNDFKVKLIEKNFNSKIIRLNQDEITKNEGLLINEITNRSLFDEKIIFFIDQVNEKILQTIEKIENLISDHQIYLFADALDKKSKLRGYFEKSKDFAIIACYEDNEISIRNIIQNKLKEFKGLTPNNINLILENSNLNRSKLNNELEKILIYFHDKNLESAKLERLLDVKTNDDFNKLKDEALLGNRNKTNKLLSETVIETEKTIYYLSLINLRLIKLSEIYNEANGNLELKINNLKPPIFWKDKPNFIAQAKKWNKDKINKILNKTYNLEVKMKTDSSINSHILLRKLILDVCQFANS